MPITFKVSSSINMYSIIFLGSCIDLLKLMIDMLNFIRKQSQVNILSSPINQLQN